MSHPADCLEDLLNVLNYQLRGFPIGPARDAEIQRIGQEFLSKATTPGEKAFWAAFAKSRN